MDMPFFRYARLYLCDHHKILHVPRQHSCHRICKISWQSGHWTQSKLQNEISMKSNTVTKKSLVKWVPPLLYSGLQMGMATSANVMVILAPPVTLLAHECTNMSVSPGSTDWITSVSSSRHLVPPLAWISNYIHYKGCDEIIHPFPNFQQLHYWSLGIRMDK